MNNHTKKDKWLYRMMVAVLGLTVLSSVIGIIALAIPGQSALEVIVALGSAGLLAPSPMNR